MCKCSRLFSLESLCKSSFCACVGRGCAHTGSDLRPWWGILWMWSLPQECRERLMRVDEVCVFLGVIDHQKMLEEENQWSCGCWAVGYSGCEFLKNLQFNKTQLTPSLFFVNHVYEIWVSDDISLSYFNERKAYKASSRWFWGRRSQACGSSLWDGFFPHFGETRKSSEYVPRCIFFFS